MESWSWIEVLWTLVAVIGAYFSANNILDGRHDLKTLNAMANMPSLEGQVLRIIAKGNIRRDSLREFIQILFLSLGLLVGFTPSSGEISLLGYLFSGILITSSFCLTVSAVGDHFDRAKMQALGTQIEARDNIV